MNIQAIEYYLPETYLTNETIVLENPEWPVDKISAKTGINKRPIASKEILSSDLACYAAQNLFDKKKISKDDIDFLLFCTQTPDYFLPTTACILQERLGLPTSIGALDFNLGCSGYVYGLSLAKGLIVSKTAKNVLLLTGETYSKLIHKNDKSNRTLFGDGASATLVSYTKGIAEIDSFCLGTDGKGAENLILKNGAFRHKPWDGKDVLNENNEFVRNDDFLYMNGNEIFNFTVKAIPGLIGATLEKHKTKLEDIDLFVFHQANQYILNFIRKIIGVPEEKFYIDMADTGNTVSSTIPVALFRALEAERIKKGDRVLIAGFGVGYSYGAAILRF